MAPTTALLAAVAAAALLLARPGAAQGTLTTAAGGGVCDGASSGATYIGAVSSLHFNGTYLYAVDPDARRVRRFSSSGRPGTFAGNGLVYTSRWGAGDGVPATSFPLDGATAIAFNAGGEALIAEAGAGRLRKVLGNGTMVTFSTGLPVGEAVDALSVDTDGNVYAASAACHCVRRVDAATGAVTVSAGTPGTSGYAGDGGPATLALLTAPQAVLADVTGGMSTAGSYVIGERTRIRKVVLATGVITTQWPSSLPYLQSLAGVAWHTPDPTLAGVNTLLVADPASNVVFKVYQEGASYLYAGVLNAACGYAGDGGRAAQYGGLTGARFCGPSAVAYDRAGLNGFIWDSGNKRIRRTYLTLIPSGDSSYAAVDVVVAFAGQGDATFCGDGLAGPAAKLAAPAALAYDPVSAAVFIADAGHARVRRLTVPSGSTSGVLTTVAGTGVPAGAGDALCAWYNASGSCIGPPSAVAVNNASGLVYVGSSSSCAVYELDPATNTIQTVAGGGGCGYDAAYDAPGSDAYAAPLGAVAGLAVAPPGSPPALFISDASNHVLWRVDLDPALGGPGFYTIGRVAGTPGTAGYGGDGGAATAALLSAPAGLKVDGAGQVIFADRGNHAVRALVPLPVGGSGYNVILLAGVPGTSGTPADGTPATAAALGAPAGIALADVGGRSSAAAYVADCGLNRVLRLSPGGGSVTTVAGDGAADMFGDGGAATAASLACPTDVAWVSATTLYVVDSGNDRLRKLVFATPSRTPSPAGTPSRTASPPPTPSRSGSPAAAGTGGASPSPSTSSRSRSPFATPPVTPPETASPTPPETVTPTPPPTGSPSPSGTGSPSVSPPRTGSSSASGTASRSASPPPSVSPSPPPTGTPSSTPPSSPPPTASGSGSASATAPPPSSPSGSPAGTPPPSPSATPPASPSGTPPATGSATRSLAPLPPGTGTATATRTRPPPTATPSRSGTPSPTRSRSPAASASGAAATPTPTATRTRSRAGSPSSSPSRSATRSRSGTPTRTPTRSMTRKVKAALLRQ